MFIKKIFSFIAIFYFSFFALLGNIFTVAKAEGLIKPKAIGTKNVVKNSFSQFQVVEYSSKSGKKFAIVLSLTKHNVASYNVLIAPIVLKNNKKAKEKVIEFNYRGKNYIIFIEKIRTVKAKTLTKSQIELKEGERASVSSALKTII